VRAAFRGISLGLVHLSRNVAEQGGYSFAPVVGDVCLVIMGGGSMGSAGEGGDGTGGVGAGVGDGIGSGAGGGVGAGDGPGTGSSSGPGKGGPSGIGSGGGISVGGVESGWAKSDADDAPITSAAAAPHNKSVIVMISSLTASGSDTGEDFCQASWQRLR
jgi:hypothetical protein